MKSWTWNIVNLFAFRILQTSSPDRHQDHTDHTATKLLVSSKVILIWSSLTEIQETHPTLLQTASTPFYLCKQIYKDKKIIDFSDTNTQAKPKRLLLDNRKPADFGWNYPGAAVDPEGDGASPMCLGIELGVFCFIFTV